MGQITVDNDYEADHWKHQFYFLTGVPPQVVSKLAVIHTISVDDALLPQEAVDALKSVYDRNRQRSAPVEVENPTPPIAEREAAAERDLNSVTWGRYGEGRADGTEQTA